MKLLSHLLKDGNHLPQMKNNHTVAMNNHNPASSIGMLNHTCTIRMVGTDAGGGVYRCGGCTETFPTVCKLHDHLMNHVTGGSYHYDHHIRTAFPKYDTVCCESQTDFSDDRDPDTLTAVIKVDKKYGKSVLAAKRKVASKCEEKIPPLETERVGRSRRHRNNSPNRVDKRLKNNRNDRREEKKEVYKSKQNINQNSIKSKKKRKLDLDGDEKVDNSGASNENMTSLVEEKNLNVQPVLSSVSERMQEVPSENRTFQSELKMGPSKPCAESKETTLKHGDICSSSSNINEDSCSSDLNSESEDGSDMTETQNEQPSINSQSNCTAESIMSVVTAAVVVNKLDGKANALEQQKSCGDSASSPQDFETIKNPLNKEMESNSADDEQAAAKDINCEFNKEKSSDSVAQPKLKKKSDKNVRQTIKKKRKPGPCKDCDMTFSSERKLRIHISLQHKHLYPYSCSHCRKNTFKTEAELTEHMKLHPHQLQKCELCGKELKSREGMRNHMLLHTGVKPFKCGDCDYTCITSSQLRLHKLRHRGEKAEQCELCGKAFYTKPQLSDHLRYCRKEKPHKCPYCPKGFPTGSGLRKHLLVHTGEKEFICDVCGFATNKTTSLKSHMRVHTGEKPYKCKECGANLATRSTLVAHIRTHTNEKPFVCSYCSKAFTSKWNLKTHLRQHTGETPYKCDVCGAGFKQNVLRKAHMKTHYEPSEPVNSRSDVVASSLPAIQPSIQPHLSYDVMDSPVDLKVHYNAQAVLEMKQFETHPPPSGHLAARLGDNPVFDYPMLSYQHLGTTE